VSSGVMGDKNMKKLLLLITVLIAGIFILFGCEKSNKNNQNGAKTMDINPNSLPVTVEGVLTYDVEKGPVGEDGISEVNFGELQTKNGPILIEVWADVLRKSKARRGDQIKATLTSATNFGNPGGKPMYTYKITEIEKIEKP
jgi:hypothetical protein